MWLAKSPTPVVVIWHGGVGYEVLRLLQGNTSYRAVGVLGSTGSIAFPGQDGLTRFLAQNRMERRQALDSQQQIQELLGTLSWFGIHPKVIIDAGSHDDLHGHPILVWQGFKVVTARKDTLAYSEPGIAQELLRSPNYGAECTIMANEWVLRRIIGERLDPSSTGPIPTILEISLISSGTLAGYVNNQLSWTSASESAQKLIANGDTEPVPPIDFCGIDFWKKLIIAARAAWYDATFDKIIFWKWFLGKDYLDLYKGHPVTKFPQIHREFIAKLEREENGKMKTFFSDIPPWRVPRYVGRIVFDGSDWVMITAWIELVRKDSQLWMAEFNIALISLKVDDTTTNPVTIAWRGSGYQKTAQWLIRDMNTLA